MIGYLIGIIKKVSSSYVIIDVNGVGFEVYMTSSNISTIKEDDKVKIYTYFHVKEDLMALFGFINEKDLNVFKELINVNGVGPKSAINILNFLTVEELLFDIKKGDSTNISKVQGIGKKTSQKIIIELKDKKNIYEGIILDVDKNKRKLIDDAVIALVNLGYNKSDSKTVVEKVYKKGIDLETLISLSISMVSKF